MMGHIYKDIVTNKGNLLAIGIVLFYAIFGVFIYSSGEAMQVLSGGTSQGSGSEFYGIVTGCLIAINFSIPAVALITSVTDWKTKWNLYAMAMPGGYEQLVLSKYLLVVFSQIVSFVLSSITLGICEIRMNMETDMLFMLLTGTTGIMFYVAAAVLPFGMKGKFRTLSIVIGTVVVIGALSLLAYVALGDISFFKQQGFMELILKWFEKHVYLVGTMIYGGFLLGMVLMYCSYRLSLKIFRKGVMEGES